MQFSKEADGTPEISPSAIKILQQKILSLLFYERDVEMTLLVAISTLSSSQAHGIEETPREMLQLLNYCATHMDAVIRYKQSDMVLEIHSDASCMSEPKSLS